jgi:predicted MFS family arabinose efflux permease
VLGVRGSAFVEKPSTPRISGELKVLVLSALNIATGFGIVAPILPQEEAGFGVSALTVSAVVSAFGLFRLLFAPASGKLTQALGE